MAEAIAVLDACGTEFELPWAPGRLRMLARDLATGDAGIGLADAANARPDLDWRRRDGGAFDVEERVGEIVHRATVLGHPAPVCEAVGRLLTSSLRHVAPQPLWERLDGARGDGHG